MKTNHHKNKPSVGNASTKLDTSEVLDLCAGIHTHTKGQLPAAGSRTLGLFTSIRLILLALRHNLTQELLAEIFGVLWVLWTLLKNGISRLLSGFGSILGVRGWVCGTLAPSGVVCDCSVTRSRRSCALWRVSVLGRSSGSLPPSCRWH